MTQMSKNKDKDNNRNDPSNPTSRLSSTARLAYYLTGGTRRGPATMTSLLRLARDRNDVKKGHKAWAAAGAADLDRHEGQWGRSGPAGMLEDARGAGPKPRGMALVRWYRETHGAEGGEEAAGRPAREQLTEDDIYGVSDDEYERRKGKGNGEAEPELHQQQSGESDDSPQNPDPNSQAEQGDQ